MKHQFDWFWPKYIVGLLIVLTTAWCITSRIFTGSFDFRPDLPRVNCRYRIQLSGTNYFVQHWGPLGWSDDIWGGYFPSFEAASNRIGVLRSQDDKFEADWQAKRQSKTVGTFP